MNKGIVIVVVMSASTVAAPAADATEYRYCVACDTHRANVLAKSQLADFGKEWYRAKTAQAFTQAYGAKSCSANDYRPEDCAKDPEETLEYREISGDQLRMLLSGNPVAMGQAGIEITVGVTVKTAQTVGDTAVHVVHEVAKAACRLFGC